MTMMHITAHANADTQASAILDFFAEMFAGMHEGRDIEMRYHALSRMTPSQLKALGLTRADIGRVAVLGK